MTDKLTDNERGWLATAYCGNRALHIIDAQAARIAELEELLDMAGTGKGDAESKLAAATALLREVRVYAPEQKRLALKARIEAFLAGQPVAPVCTKRGCPRDGECPVHGRNRPGQGICQPAASVVVCSYCSHRNPTGRGHCERALCGASLDQPAAPTRTDPSECQQCGPTLCDAHRREMYPNAAPTRTAEVKGIGTVRLDAPQWPCGCPVVGRAGGSHMCPKPTRTEDEDCDLQAGGPGLSLDEVRALYPAATRTEAFEAAAERVFTEHAPLMAGLARTEAERRVLDAMQKAIITEHSCVVFDCVQDEYDLAVAELARRGLK